MKLRYSIASVMAVLLALSFAGCGDDEGPNSPGSAGSGKTGLIMWAQIDPDSPDIDAFRNPDCDGDPATDDPELFESEYENVNIGSRYASSNQTRRDGYKLFITKYTISYSSDVKGAPPIRKRTVYESVAFDADSGAQFGVDLVDLASKIDYEDKIDSGKFSPASDPVRYTLMYTFYGHDSDGNAFTIDTNTRIKMGHFDNCS